MLPGSNRPPPRTVDPTMRTDELDFDLPPDLIAQEPLPQRPASRLMHYRRSDRSVDHRTFSDLPRLLRRGDLLVFNNARVLPARFVLRKISGGRVEGLFLEELGVGRWRVLLRNLGSYRGDELLFERDPDLACRVLSTGDGGEWEIDVFSEEPATILLSR